MLISHDQAFIDSCANVIVSFEDKNLISYTGNYSSYQKQRAERLALAQKQYEKQEQKKQHLTSFILRFKAKASKAKQAQSRVKQLEKMEALLPIQAANEFSFAFKEPDKLPNPLINMESVQLGYDATIILSNIHLNLVPGSRIGLLGRNGAGKSTFIKLLAGELSPLQGRYNTSAGLKIGYFAQHQVQALNLENSAFDHLLALDRQLTDQQIRDYLGGFGFHGDEALKKVAPMSGGEKARLVLSLIVYSKPNLLLLDEPTNHLDMNMREALAYALQSFEGAMVIVSHDRYLLESVCDDFYLVDSGAVSSFSGDLTDYQKWLFANKADRKTTADAESKNEGPSIDRKVLKRMEAEFRQSTKAFRESILKSEKHISKYQSVLDETENKMLDTSLYEAENKHLLNGLIAKQVDAKSKIEELEMEWLESQEQLEHAQAEFERSKAGS
ncbi:MAG: ATP-binding cassette subfamily F protein 3 [Glaciecola sp.]